MEFKSREQEQMNMIVNGETQKVADTPLSIAGLLDLNHVESPEMVSVQLNGEFVDRKKYQDTLLKEQDEVDFLYFMGGGRA
jgi:sulfur carrier protein